jgi:hypothetical protein
MATVIPIATIDRMETCLKMLSKLSGWINLKFSVENIKNTNTTARQNIVAYLTSQAVFFLFEFDIAVPPQF